MFVRRLVWLLLLAACVPSGAERKRTRSESEAPPPATVFDAGLVVDRPDAAPEVADVDAGVADQGVAPDAGDICLETANKPVTIGRSNVYYGTRSPTYLPMTPAQVRAVVAISNGRSGSFCSGTLITPTIVLTAKHCTEGTAGGSFYVLFGQDDERPELAIRTIQKREHPSRDTTLLQLASDATTQIEVTPIPIPLNPLTNAQLGITLEQAGFGQTESGRSNGRFFVAEPLVSLDNQELTVDGQGQHGVCFGDSGGPSMMIAPEGDIRVVGDLSWGDPSCTGRDRYARVDVLRTWIEEWTGPTPGAGPVPCGAVTSEGRCSSNQTEVTFCRDGGLVRETCATNSVCGWNSNESGWRCLPRASDPCQGIGFAGECNNNTLRWCDRGQVLTRPCGQCGETCTRVSEEEGFACAVTNCGDVDTVGRCDGNSAVYCENGQRQTDDCTAAQDRCGETGGGFRCLRDCGDLDYQGRCAGNTAEWCNQNNQRQTRDCAAEGMTCRYVNDELGYYCAQ